MKAVTYLGSLVQLCCGEGGTLEINTTGMFGECLQYMDHTGFAPVHSGVCFPGLHCSGSSVLFRALSKAGPEICALPRSKQVRRPGACEHTVPGRLCILITSPISAARFPGVPREHQLRCAMCLFWQLFSDCNPPGGCQPSRIPGRHG